MGQPVVERMSGSERREQILAAAVRVFAEGGYAATTDLVARAAGVSQPYVVRLFGSKQRLFAEVYASAAARIVAAFEAVPPGPDASEQMGQTYIRLMMADQNLLMVLMHGFVAGADETIGSIARRTLGDVFRIYRDRTGGSEDEARAFVGHGMLINVLMATRAPEHAGEDAELDALTACALGPEAIAGLGAGAAAARGAGAGG